MDFWNLIATSKAQTADVEAQADWLIEHLVKDFKVKEIFEYQRELEKAVHSLSTAKMWLAAEFLMAIDDEEELDERFPGFCAWVVAQGKEVVERAIENPDDLADLLEINEEGEFVCECEMMLYVADNAYEMKTGEEDFYDKYDDQDVIFEIAGDFPAEVDFEQIFPKISAKLLG